MEDYLILGGLLLLCIALMIANVWTIYKQVIKDPKKNKDWLQDYYEKDL